MFLLNLPLSLSLLRQNRALRRLGLRDVPNFTGQVEVKRMDFVGFVDICVGLVAPLVVATLAAMIGLLYFLRVDNFSLDSPFLLSPLIFLCGVGGSIGTVYVRKKKQKLDYIDRLSGVLNQYGPALKGAPEERVEIPEDIYRKVAEVERSEISKERAREIVETLREPETSPYSLRISRNARHVQACLNVSVRLKVEEQIGALIEQCSHANGICPAGDRTLYHRNPEFQIEYSIESESRELRILDIRAASAESI